jgi:oxygen-independent coproporphyrinogen-3 oxidase
MASFPAELQRRMAGPQRHRLLQGYPMLPLLQRAAPDPLHERRIDGSLTPLGGARDPRSEPPWIRLDPSRPLIVGVLPHTQCNPEVEGCGFCTFPHDRYDKYTLLRTASDVEAKITGLFQERPDLAGRRVDAVYFGGATANLTPRAALRSLGERLARHLDLGGAEITLEGVPSLFRSLFAGPFEAMLDLPARHRRISMGVQTFDDDRLARMGRRHFGDRRTIRQVIQKAHKKGLTVSGDFLINMPGEPRAQMLDDVREAAALGFDQICVYHLVLTEGAGTPWAEDPALLAALPELGAACDNWLAVRAWLLENGFVQTTLTNFERAEASRGERRFVYEEHSFSPERYDALGFGPLSISTFVDLEQRRAVKLVRGKRLDEPGNPDDLFFAYAEEDLRLLHLTRTLARLRVERAGYRAVFGADLTEHFGEALAAIEEAGLCTLDDEALRLTPRGMFYADSAAGLLAWPRALALRPSGAGERTRDLLKRRVMVDFMG